MTISIIIGKRLLEILVLYLLFLDIWKRFADKIDDRDAINEGSHEILAAYKKIGRPYIRDYAISAIMTYQFIMSPLMSQLLTLLKLTQRIMKILSWPICLMQLFLTTKS